MENLFNIVFVSEIGKMVRNSARTVIVHCKQILSLIGIHYYHYQCKLYCFTWNHSKQEAHTWATLLTWSAVPSCLLKSSPELTLFDYNSTWFRKRINTCPQHFHFSVILLPLVNELSQQQHKFSQVWYVAKWFLSKVELVKKFTGGQMNTYTWSEKLICAFSSGELKCFKNLYICRTKQK